MQCKYDSSGKRGCTAKEIDRFTCLACLISGVLGEMEKVVDIIGDVPVPLKKTALIMRGIDNMFWSEDAIIEWIKNENPELAKMLLEEKEKKHERTDYRI